MRCVTGLAGLEDVVAARRARARVERTSGGARQRAGREAAADGRAGLSVQVRHVALLAGVDKPVATVVAHRRVEVAARAPERAADVAERHARRAVLVAAVALLAGFGVVVPARRRHRARAGVERALARPARVTTERTAVEAER